MDTKRFICPNCKNCKKTNNSYFSVCDNSCDTLFCNICDSEYYYVKNILTGGHDPKCGYDSEYDANE